MSLFNRGLDKTLYYLLAITVFVPILTAPAAAREKQIVGWIEEARVYPGGLLIHAKLDTGARHSSLNVRSVTDFKRNGKKWVRFDVTNPRSPVADRPGQHRRIKFQPSSALH